MLKNKEREFTESERRIFRLGLDAGFATGTKRCVGLVLDLFAQQRQFPEIARLLDDLANRMEHPELAQLEDAANRPPYKDTE
jgi:hypothetical protein